MFYYYFRLFNWISSIFGLRKPFIIAENIPVIPLWSKLWSILIAVFALASHLLAINFEIAFNIKDNLDELSNINNLIVNIIVIFNSVYKEYVYYKLYENFIKIFIEMKLSNKNVKMICYKMYIFGLTGGIVFIITIILELIFDDPPYIILLRIPLFFTIYHLIVHLCLILSILRFINYNMVEMVKLDTKTNMNIFLETKVTSQQMISYLLDPKMNFIDVNPKKVRLTLKVYCIIYDDLCTSIQLLEKCHGGEVLLSIWLMFTSAVTAITLISNDETPHPWLEVLRGIQVYVWFCIGCYIDDQISQQVDLIEIIIIKNLINFRCGQVTKEVLQTFKLVINTNRLQFTAGNLYRLNYATMLGTIVSVITYSVISIQLF